MFLPVNSPAVFQTRRDNVTVCDQTRTEEQYRLLPQLPVN